MTIDKTKKTPPQTPRIEIGLTPRILDRYVAKEFLLGYLIAVFVVLSLRVVLDLFIELDEFVEDSPSGTSSSFFTVIGYIVAYYTPKLFEYFRDFSGVMIILAAAFSLVRMSRQNELTAVLASGISLKRLLAPIILLAMLLNLLMVFDQEVILPRLADKLVREHDEIAGVDPMKVSLLLDRNNALLSGKFNPDTKTLTQLFIILRRDGMGSGLITAEKGVWNPRHQHWQLTNGMFFSAEGLREPRKTWPSDLSPDYLWLQKNANFKSLMSSAQLADLIRSQRKPAEQRQAISEKHFRFTDPIINMVMLLLGLPLLVTRERFGSRTAFFLAIVGPASCFIVTFVCKLIGSGLPEPLLAAWLPLIVFLPLSVIALDGIKT